MVMFRNDLDTFCKYVAHRPPNVDHTVHQHLEDRHLENGMRGIYYVACYRHQPEGGEEILVQLDQYCGRIDPDGEADDEAMSTMHEAEAMDQRVHDAVAAVQGTVRKGPIRYTGEIMPHPA